MRRSLSLLVGLLSSAAAACSGAGQDALVTVGVRPTVVVATSDDKTASDAGQRFPGSDVMVQVPDGNSTTRPTGTAGSPGPNVETIETRTPARPSGTSAPSQTRSGAAGAAMGAAGAGGSRAATNPGEDECGAVPAQAAGNISSGRVSGPGLIEYDVDSPNVFSRLRTTVSVPAEPPPNGPIFIWSGLQPTPNGMNFQPIGNGGLMPVLAWGASCGTDAPEAYSTWWLVPVYSNISSSDPQYAGCHTGKAALAKPKQLIDIDVRLDGTTWTQKIVNRDTMAATELSIDLKGQAQGRVFFDIELQTNNKPTEDVVFTNTVLSMDMSDANACQPVLRGMNDFASKPRVSADGKHCCIDRITLRAPGVSATTMDPP